MKIYIRKMVQIILLLLTIFLVGGILIHKQTDVSVSLSDPKQLSSEHIIIIDAGHGGEDGGAVAADGTVESQINLQISERIFHLCAFLGVNSRMIRTADCSLADRDAKSLRQMKVTDLKNRVQLVNSYENRTLLSIHQNSLPSSKSVHGAQVFYNKVDGSVDIALNMQNLLNASVNISNHKECKPMAETIFLMKKVTCRAVLVECGFMSNPQEVQLLKTGDYQTKLAVTILSGMLDNKNNELE